MFCPKCGKELPDDSQFCVKCGHAMPVAESSPVPHDPVPSVPVAPAAVPPPVAPIAPAAPAMAQPSGGGKWGWKLVGVVFVIVLLWALAKGVSSLSHNTGGTGSGSALSQIVPQARTQTIVDGALTVAARGSTYYPITVPADATAVSVDGHFTATGGIGNDIEVYVLTEDNFVNFKNGHPSPTLYNSGKVTQDSISVTLPASGNYYLVFNNNFSLLTPKAVQATATLHFTN